MRRRSRRCSTTCATRCARKTARASPRRRSASACASSSSASTRNPRYPDAESVPYTELINPVLTPLSDEIEDGWEGCLSVPGLRGVVPALSAAALSRPRSGGPGRSSARSAVFTRASSSTNATTWTASCIRCASGISRGSASPTCCSRSLRTRRTIDARRIARRAMLRTYALDAVAGVGVAASRRDTHREARTGRSGRLPRRRGSRATATSSRSRPATIAATSPCGCRSG